jgi:hypothetical protein
VKEDRDFDDHLNMFESLILTPTVDAEASRIIIPFQDLMLLPGNRFFGELITLPSVRLIFETVQKSKRTLSYYYGEDRKSLTGEQVTTEDGPFPTGTDESYHFVVEGVFDTPSGWIHWGIEAAGYSVEV